MKKKISEEQNRKLELICVAALIVFALLSFFFTRYSKASGDTYKKIVIYVESSNVWQCDIKDLVDEKIVVYSIDGKTVAKVITNDLDDIKNKCEYNIIEIRDKQVSCIESNCPNKVCISHGTLKSNIDNDMIICAPHKMTIVYE